MPMLEFRLASATGERPIFVPGGFGPRTIHTLDDLAQHIANKHGISPRTVWKWYCQFQESSFRALANGLRTDHGHSRYFAAHPIAQQIVERYLGGGMSIRDIHRALCRELPGEAPSYGTLRAYLNSKPTLVRALVQKRKARP